MKPKKLLPIFLAIIGLGSFIRLVNLGILPIFADEAIYVRWSQVMRSEPSLRFLPLTDGKQPLYMWLVMPFLKLFSDPLLAGRTVSAVAGLGTLIGVGTGSYILFKNLRLSLLCSLLWAVIPYSVFFDRMALADSLLTMFLVWAFNFMALSVIKLRWDFAMLSGFSLGFAYLTKTPAIFYYFLLPLLITLVPRHSISKIWLLKVMGLFLTAMTISFAMYNILRLGPEFHQIAIRNRDYIRPLGEVLSRPMDPLIPHLKDALGFYFIFVTPLGLLFVLWGMLETRKSHLAQSIVLAAFFLVPIFVQSFVAKTFTARYLYFTVPFAVILMAHALERLGQRTQKHLLTYLGFGSVFISALWVDYRLVTNPDSASLPRIERSGYLEEWTAGHGIKDISSYLAKAARDGPVLVGSEGFFGTPFNALELYLNQVPGVRITGVGVNISTTPESLITALKDNQVFLVVNSSRFAPNPADPEFKSKYGLDLIASFPKSLKPDGTRESLLFFRVLPQ